MMINRSDELYCFRILKNRVFYISESNMRLASNISNDNLVALGTCVGKFTKSGKFHLTIHCLDYLSQYAKVRDWFEEKALIKNASMTPSLIKCLAPRPTV